jgi:hypothetical protein
VVIVRRNIAMKTLGETVKSIWLNEIPELFCKTLGQRHYSLPVLLQTRQLKQMVCVPRISARPTYAAVGKIRGAENRFDFRKASRSCRGGRQHVVLELRAQRGL